MLDPDQRSARISHDQLAGIADLLAIIDVFLRSHLIPHLLAQHVRGIGSNHSGYDAALLIDRISFTAGTLRAYSTPPDEA